MATTSRLNRVAEKKFRRQGLIYLVLSVVFILLMVRWGVPGFIQLISWVAGEDSPKQSTSGLKIPPQAPALTPIDEATFSATIRVTGIAQPGIRVKLISNGQVKDEQQTDVDGNFNFLNVALLEGKNIIGVQSFNDDGLESNIAQTEVYFDNEKPDLEIFEPLDEAEFVGPDQQHVQIRGTMNERGEVFVNNNFVSVSVGGDFTYRYPLEPGVNEIVITASDRAGNQTSRLLRLHFSQ